MSSVGADCCFKLLARAARGEREEVASPAEAAVMAAAASSGEGEDSDLTLGAAELEPVAVVAAARPVVAEEVLSDVELLELPGAVAPEPVPAPAVVCTCAAADTKAVRGEGLLVKEEAPARV